MATSLLLGPRCARPGRLPCCKLKQHNVRRTFLRVRAESPLIEEVADRRISAPVFNRTRWKNHQDTSRYVRHLQSILKSVIFRNLQGPLSSIALVSCLVVSYRTLVEVGDLPDLFEGVRFTDVPFQLTSFALSLLLVFRTDASYSRWCAAMDAWGTLRISTSQLVRKASAWVGDPGALRRLVRWLGAFPLALMVELRHDPGDPVTVAAIRRELRGVLRPNEVEQVVASGPYYHQFCLSVLTAQVEAAGLGGSREATMLEDLNGFNQAACECEKILRFPIPLTYTRHTSRFMLIYLGALPLALYDSCEWASIPVTVVMAFLLLGIEDIGVQIEEPFSILPLPDICGDLRAIAQRAVDQRDMVRCLADPALCGCGEGELPGEGDLPPPPATTATATTTAAATSAVGAPGSAAVVVGSGGDGDEGYRGRAGGALTRTAGSNAGSSSSSSNGRSNGGTGLNGGAVVTHGSFNLSPGAALVTTAVELGDGNGTGHGHHGQSGCSCKCKGGDCEGHPGGSSEGLGVGASSIRQPVHR